VLGVAASHNEHAPEIRRVSTRRRWSVPTHGEQADQQILNLNLERLL
jgi:hypothetical protein